MSLQFASFQFGPPVVRISQSGFRHKTLFYRCNVKLHDQARVTPWPLTRRQKSSRQKSSACCRLASAFSLLFLVLGTLTRRHRQVASSRQDFYLSSHLLIIGSYENPISQGSPVGSGHKVESQLQFNKGPVHVNQVR